MRQRSGPKIVIIALALILAMRGSSLVLDTNLFKEENLKEYTNRQEQSLGLDVPKLLPEQVSEAKKSEYAFVHKTGSLASSGSISIPLRLVGVLGTVFEKIYGETLNLFAPKILFAAPPTSAFTPGETLDPSCSPGDAFCTVAAVAAGSDGQVQFNNGGNFGGAGGFVFASTTRNVGIGTTSPFARLSVAGGNLHVGGTITATSTATSTFTGGLSTALLSVTSTTASSTFANGLNLTAGCFSINGTCVGGSSSGFTVGEAWTISTNTFGQSALIPTTTQNIAVNGVGTSTFAGGLSAFREISAPFFTATSTTATSTFANHISIGTSTGDGSQFRIGGEGILTRVGTAVIGGDITGNSRGAASIDVQGVGNGRGVTEVASGSQSVAFGARNTASGITSMTFGILNIANTTGAGAFGFRNTSSGTDSYAFGSDNTPSGTNSIAVGYSNAAGGQATALGYDNTASAFYTSAVGYQNNVTGQAGSGFGFGNTVAGTSASAFGVQNIGSGDSSVAIGYQSTASASGAVAIGKSIVNATANSAMFGNTDAAKLTILSTGETLAPFYTATTTGATSSFQRLGADILRVSTTTATSTFAYGVNIAGGCFAINGTCVGGSSSGFTVGEAWSLTTNTFGQSALAPTTTQNIAVNGIGTSTFAGGLEAWRQISAPYFQATSTTATSTFAGNISIGTTTGDGSQFRIGGEGILTRIGTTIIAGSLSGNARGVDSIDIQANGHTATEVASGLNASAFGYRNTASGTGGETVALGALNTSSGLSRSSAIGVLNTASSQYSVAIGYQNTASTNIRTVAIGINNTATGLDSVALGRSNSSADEKSTVVGYANTETGSFATAVGYTNTSAAYGSAFGFNNTSSAFGTSIGYSNSTSGNGAVALGWDNTASAAYATAIGKSITNATANSVMIGPSNTAKLTILSTGETLAPFYTATTTDATSSFQRLGADILRVSTTTATSTFAYGVNLAAGCFAINGTCVGGSGSGTVNSGTEGQIAFYASNGTAVSATSTLFLSVTNPHVGIGTTTATTTAKATVDGSLRVTSSTGAVVVGDTSGNARGTNALDLQSLRTAPTQVASGFESIAVGMRNIASSDSIAFGDSNTSSGADTLAFGLSNTSNGTCSLAYGNANTSSGLLTGAFGFGNTASANYAQAFGRSVNNDTASSVKIGPSNAAALTITSTGDVRATGFTATSTTATSTLTRAEISTLLNVTASATSSFSNGLNLTAGCFAINGTCVGGSGSGTVNSGTEGQIAFYASNGTAVSATSTLFLSTTVPQVSIGTTTATSTAIASIDGGLFISSSVGSVAIGNVTVSATGTQATAVGVNNRAGGTGSTALGFKNTASGVYASAVGRSNTARNDPVNFSAASAFGNSNTASGYQSSAFGDSNNANTTFTNAFGFANTASNFKAVAFGISNTVSGSNASGFGLSNTSSNYKSSAFGQSNTASATSSSAFGFTNTASATSSSAFGFTNTSSGVNASTFGLNNSATAIGASAFGSFLSNGTASSTMLGVSNTASLTVLSTGETRIPFVTATTTDATSSFQRLGADILRVSTTTATSTFAYGVNLAAGCFAINGTCVGGSGSGTVNSGLAGQIAHYAADGTAVSATSTLFLSVTNPHVGIGTTTATTTAKATVDGSLRVTSSTGAVVVGDTSGNARGTNALDLQSLRTAPTQVASGFESIAVGMRNIASSDSIAFGDSNTSSGADTLAFGLSNTSNGTCSLAYGNANTSSGLLTGAFGFGNTASANYAQAFGRSVNNDTASSVKIGPSNAAALTITSTGDVRATGFTATSTTATSTLTRAEISTLLNVTASATSSFSNGLNLTAGCFAINGTCVGGSGSNFTLGEAWSITTNTFGQSALAPTTTQNIAVNGVGTSTFAGGLEAWRQISAPYFQATSSTANSSFQGSVSVGTTTSTTTAKLSVDGGVFVSSSVGSIAIGNTFISATGTSAVSVGIGNFAGGAESSAFGVRSKAFGIGSGAFGINNTASGQYGHALGITNTASGQYSSAFGKFNTSSGSEGVAVGADNTASGSESSAVGVDNTASQTQSSAFGNDNLASAARASAFGFDNTASAYHSSAFGYQNTASANYSIAIGRTVSNTIASSLMIGPSNTAKLTILSTGETQAPFFSATTTDATSSFQRLGADILRVSTTTATSTFAYGVNLAAGCFAINGTCVGGSGSGTVNSGTTGLLAYYASDGTAVSQASNVFFDNTNKRLGIGTTSPSQTLTVGGGIYGSSITLSTTTATSTIAGLLSVGTTTSTTTAKLSVDGGVFVSSSVGSIAIGNTTVSATGTSAVNVGIGNLAGGDSSAAFGSSNKAFGAVSAAIGNSNTATGQGSSAIGNSDTASGLYSSALGYANTASATNAQAVGYNNTASNTSASAFGLSNNVSGLVAAAFGSSNTVSGNYSVAFGRSNSITVANAVAVGRSITNSIASSLMIGPSNTAKLTILSTGETQAPFFTATTSGATSTFKGLSADLLQISSTTATSTFANGLNLTAGCFAINGTCVGGGSGVSSGVSGAIQFSDGASGFTSDAGQFFWNNTTKRLGLGTTSPGAKLSIGGGDLLVGGIITSTSTTGTSTFAGLLSVGTTTATTTAKFFVDGGIRVTSSIGAVIVGDTSGNSRGTDALDVQSGRTAPSRVASGSNASAFGYNNFVSASKSSASGYNNYVSGTYSSAFGYQNTVNQSDDLAVGSGNTANAGGATAVGKGNNVTGLRGSASGYGNTISTTYSSAFGYQNTLTGSSQASAFGYINTASGYKSTASGYSNDATGGYSSAIGYNNTANTSGSTALGYQNTSSGTYSIASGVLNTSSGSKSSASGYNNYSSGNYSSAFGYKNTASGSNSVAIGSNIKNGVADSVQIGNSNAASLTILSTGETKVPFLSATSTTGTSTFAGLVSLGTTTATTTAKITIDGGIRMTSTNGAIVVSGGQMYGNARGAGALDIQTARSAVTQVASGSLNAVAVGANNTVSGACSAIAFGVSNTSSASYSLSVGLLNQATSTTAVAFGYTNNAGGSNSVAIGQNNNAFGSNSLAFGYANTSTLLNAMAFGISNTVTGENNIGVGYSNTVSGSCSAVVFGLSNTASGSYSLAVGRSNQATSSISTSFGYANNAGGGSSSAVGFTNSAFSDQSSAFGYNNVVSGACTSVAFGSNNIVNVSSGSGSSGAFGLDITNSVANTVMIGPSNAAKLTIAGGATGSAITGHVGLGTTTPTGRLTIAQSGNVATSSIWLAATDGDHRAIYMNTSNVLNFQDGDDTASLSAAGVWTDAPSFSYLKQDREVVSKEKLLEIFASTTIETFKVISDVQSFGAGADTKLGIVLDEAHSLLSDRDINGNVIGYSPIRTAAAAFRGIQILTNIFDISNATTSLSSLSIADNGNIGIGTSTPDYKLHVIGDVAAQAFVNTSTRSSKTDISYLKDEDYQGFLNKLSGINVATYRYTTDSTETGINRLGLIAEEAPSEVLSANGDGVDIYKLVNFTLGATKAQHKIVQDLALRVEKLEQLGVSGTGGGVSFASVLSSLESLGTRIVDGIVYMRNLVTGNLTVGSRDKPSGITLYDEVTKEPYCLKISNGVPVSVQGTCPLVSTSSSDTPAQDGTSADTQAPVITVNGNNPALVDIGVSYVDLGAMVTDNVNNNLGIVTIGAEINTSVAGTFTVTYNATDQAGNVGTATRTVIVGNPVEEEVVTPEPEESQLPEQEVITPEPEEPREEEAAAPEPEEDVVTPEPEVEETQPQPEPAPAPEDVSDVTPETP